MLKKILVSVVLAMMCVAPAVMAADVAVEGTYVVDGDYYDTGDVSYSYYSHELDVAVTFKTDENTYLSTSFGLVDRTWGDDEDTIYDSEFTLDLAWLTHKFNGYTAEVGLMPGGAWGTMLGDADDGYLCLQLTKDMSFGSIVAYIQKNQEEGASEPLVEDNEKDDNDEISLGMTFKAGSINIMPMITYTDDSEAVDDNGKDGVQTLLANLALNGEIDAFGFEAELNYWDVSVDGGTDYSNFNVYADAWTTIDALKAGVALAYGTEDDGNYEDFGVDFAPMVLMDNDGDISGLGAMVFAKIYGEYTINEKLSAGVAAAYGDFEEDAVGTSDTGVSEFDITGAYKITDALTYYVSAAYADVEALDDPIIYLGHEIEFCF